MVQYAFAGIRAGVLALICKTLVSMYRQCPRNLFSYLLAGAAFWAHSGVPGERAAGDFKARCLHGLVPFGHSGEEAGMIFWELFWTFFQIGAFTFGGGSPCRPHSVGSGKPRLDDGHSTGGFCSGERKHPGPFAVNISHLRGYGDRGPLGRLAPPWGGPPLFSHHFAGSPVLRPVPVSPIVQGGIVGLRPAVVGLIAAAVVSVG